jgi:hypothetical protein
LKTSSFYFYSTLSVGKGAIIVFKLGSQVQSPKCGRQDKEICAGDNYQGLADVGDSVLDLSPRYKR